MSRRVLLVLLALLALAGCGGGTSAVDPADFHTQAGMICAEARRGIANLPAAPRTRSQFLSRLDRAAALQQVQVRKLAVLSPPQSQAPDFRRLLGADRALLTATHDFRSAIATRDPKSAELASAAANKAVRAADRSATRLGLVACAENGS